MSTDDQDLSPETRALLKRGRHGHGLSDGHRQALKRALLVNVAGGALATTTTAAAWTGVAAKVVGSAVLAVLVGGGAYVATLPRHVDGTVTSTAVERATAPTKPSPREPAPVPAPSEPSAPSVPPVPTAVTASAPRAITQPNRAVAAEPAPPPALPTATVTYSPLTPPVDTAGGPAPATITYSPIDAPADPTTTPASIPHGSSLEADAQLLRDADHALKLGDGPTAIRLLDAHAKQYPNSVLQPERSADRVLALCSVGRVGDARREAALFLTAHPSGPLASKVTSSCGGPDH